MKKLFFLFLLAFSFVGNSQVKVNFGSINGNVGDTVSVTVNIDNFTKISSFQYSVTYDSLVLQYVGWGDRHSTISNVSVQDFDMWRNTRLINGQLAVSWNNDAGKSNTIPANESVFSLKFKLIGKQCDSSFVKLDNKPTPIEFIDENDNPLSFNSVGGIGKVKINGPGCVGGTGGGPSTDVSLIASIESGPQNGITYINISVKNFKNMLSGQGTITWDPAVGEYAGMDSTFVSRFDFGFGGLTNKSGVSYIFSNNSSTGVTLPDNYVIFKIGIKGVGAINSSTAINFGNVPTILELSDYDINLLNGIYIAGKFTILDTSQEAIKLYYKDTFAAENSQLCVPILVDGFNCMESFQFAIKFDTTLLKFKGINDPKIMHFGNANVNLVGDKLNLIWDNSTSLRQTLSNGSYMFLVCFDIIGKCTTTTKLSFLPQQSALEFRNCNGFLAVNKGEPNIEIRCGIAPTTCVIDSAVSISCNGVCDGRAGVTIGGGSGVGFTYEWLRISPAPTGVVSTVQNPTGLCPGEYRLRFLDIGNTNAQSQCPSVLIRDVEPLTCIGNTTGVSGVGKSDGRIELTVTGGTPNYKYAWFRIGNPNLSIGNSNVLANLAVNTYIVVVTDANGCTKRDTFKIDAFVDTIQITGIRMIDSIKCFGECTGALQVDISGGINPYNYRWVGPSGTIFTNPARNLCAGLWKVAVTDGKAETDSLSFLMTEPVSISISSTQITHEQNGSDGKIEISEAMGGTPPYSYSWSNGSNVKDLINVAGGKYFLTVTDNNKCTKTWSFIINSKKGSALICDPPTVQNSKCSDPCNGSISLNFKGGEAPYNYSAKHGNTQLTGGPDYQNLCSGSYSFTVTDKVGSTCSVQSTIINESNQVLTIEIIKCAESNIISNGQYKVNSNGGLSPYTYQWCNNESTATATQLPSGPCSVTVIDNNGCSKTISFEVCVSVASDEIPDLITPNGDGRNDQFILPASISSLGAIQLTIANRWGDVVYRSDDYKNDWDGREQKSGEDLPPTSYYYVLSQSGKIIQKGIISILR
jgi:gliding motility-associated-like protein